LDLASALRFEDWDDSKSNLTSAIGYLANCGIQQAIFPTIIPWPMTLAPTNEAIGCENHAKNHIRETIPS
jgi:hypothetical protein